MSPRRSQQGGGSGFLLLAIVVGWFGFTHHDLFDTAAAATTPAGPAAPHQVKEWIAQADTALVAAGASPSKLNPDDTWLIIQHESGGRPHAINLTDSNARAGHPSKGLMQEINSTFEANRLTSLPDDVYDPVANIAAGILYAIRRYGSIREVPGVVAVHAGKPYVGY